MMKVFSICLGFLIICSTLPVYGQGYKNLENLALKAIVEAEGSDIPVENVNDGDFTTRWNAKNDDVDTWITFTWEEPQPINRVHVTEFRSRITGHIIEYGEKFDEVKNLKMTPEDPADAAENHPGNQREPVEIPDHILIFDTVKTTIIRYHVTKTRGPSDEPSLWEIEIFSDPELLSVYSAGKLAATWAMIKKVR